MKSPRPSLPMTGGCQCGAIRYEITSFPLLLYTCNCTDCQRQTGSAFALNMPVRFEDFRILQGEPNGWHHTSPNGTAVISRFCGNCGTRLYGERDGRPETVSLRAGTLDDTSWLVPVAHFFTRSAQPWVNRRPARNVSKPSRTAGEACCPDGVPAGPTRPIERPRGLLCTHPFSARQRACGRYSLTEKIVPAGREPPERMGNYHWFGRQFWSS